MEAEKKIEVATAITAALITAGHVPAVGCKGEDDSAGRAIGLLQAVLKRLSDLDANGILGV